MRIIAFLTNFLLMFRFNKYIYIYEYYNIPWTLLLILEKAFITQKYIFTFYQPKSDYQPNN